MRNPSAEPAKLKNTNVGFVKINVNAFTSSSPTGIGPPPAPVRSMSSSSSSLVSSESLSCCLSGLALKLAQKLEPRDGRRDLQTWKK